MVLRISYSRLVIGTAVTVSVSALLTNFLNYETNQDIAQITAMATSSRLGLERIAREAEQEANKAEEEVQRRITKRTLAFELEMDNMRGEFKAKTEGWVAEYKRIGARAQEITDRVNYLMTQINRWEMLCQGTQSDSFTSYFVDYYTPEQRTEAAYRRVFERYCGDYLRLRDKGAPQGEARMLGSPCTIEAEILKSGEFKIEGVDSPEMEKIQEALSLMPKKFIPLEEADIKTETYKITVTVPSETD